MVSRLYRGDGAACLFHNPGQFMSKDHRRMHFGRTFAPVINMYVRAADTAGGNADQHIMFPCFRYRDLIQPELFVP